MGSNLLLKKQSNFKISFFRLTSTAIRGNRKDTPTRTRACNRRPLRPWILACAPSFFLGVTVAAQTGVFPTSTPQFASTPAPGIGPVEAFERTALTASTCRMAMLI